MSRNTCPDCGSEITYYATRCVKCKKAKTVRDFVNEYNIDTWECVPWRGAVTGRYPRAVKHTGGKLAHVAIYIRVRGKLLRGRKIDHMCRNTICMNVRHMEPVTPSENAQRGYPFRWKTGDVCPRGHTMTLDNTWIRPDRNHRVCRACKGRSLPPSTIARQEFVIICGRNGAAFVHRLKDGLLTVVPDFEDLPETYTSENTIFFGNVLDRN